MVKLVLDAMGGDFAPEKIVKGAEIFIEKNSATLPIEKLYLVGLEDKVSKYLKSNGNGLLEIVHAPKYLKMDEKFKRDKETSLYKGLQLVLEEKADVFISAGNTAAVMAGSYLLFKTMEGIERPAIPTLIPRWNGMGPFVLLDAGANVDCKPKHLYHFAIMGAAYYKAMFGKEKPKVALLNIGEEEIKGNKLVKDTKKLFDETEKKFEFVGYIEPNTMFEEEVDVVVADGFVGNIVLKALEGLANSFMKYILPKEVLVKKKKELDSREYGGAPLLGLNKLTIIAHGSSDEIAISNALKVAVKLHSENIIDGIRKLM